MKRLLSAREVTEIRRMRDDGRSVNEIAERTGRSTSTVYRYVRDMPPIERVPLGLSSRARRLLAAANSGVTHREIADRFGLKSRQVAAALVCRYRKVACHA